MRLLQLICLALVVTLIYAGVTGVGTGVAKASGNLKAHQEQIDQALSDTTK